jgi:photosystem II stability/assembly factor-like uncharacterized protein
MSALLISPRRRLTAIFIKDAMMVKGFSCRVWLDFPVHRGQRHIKYHEVPGVVRIGREAPGFKGTMKIAVITAVACGFLFDATSLFSQTWTQIVQHYYPFSMGTSADGTKLVAASGDFGVIVSTNSGATWSGPPGLGNAVVATVSANGSHFYAIAEGFQVSTNDGHNWSKLSPPSARAFIVCSADGTKLLTALGWANPPSGSPLYMSSDSGVTWVTENAPVAQWRTAACSADGSKLVAAINGSGIYTSTDYGITWTSNAVPAKYSLTCACSADGGFLVAAALVLQGGIFTSTNFGATWTSNTAPLLNWSSIACSADGSKLVVASPGMAGAGGPIYSSVDFGQTWILNNAPIANWSSVAISADGNVRYAAGQNGLWISVLPSSQPRLNISSSGSNIAVSWPVSSTNFILQQSADLSTGIWIQCTNPPTFNCTNLYSEAIFSPTDSGNYFRLSTQ